MIQLLLVPDTSETAMIVVVFISAIVAKLIFSLTMLPFNWAILVFIMALETHREKGRRSIERHQLPGSVQYSQSIYNANVLLTAPAIYIVVRVQIP
jgi:hypothetical protein